MQILYFARVREQAGIGEETVSPPAGVADVAALVDWLRARGGGPARALADLGGIRVAVNQEHARLDHPLRPDDEVAFFPPITGGSGR